METRPSLKLEAVEALFGQVLQQLRKEARFSQEELGFESGYHRTYISLLERGKKNPSLKTIFQLAEALGVQPSVFIERVQDLMNVSDLLNIPGPLIK